MAKQSKTRSWVEAWINIGIGYGVNFLANLPVFPLFGLSISITQNIQIGIIYTFISPIRSYCIRRVMSKGD